MTGRSIKETEEGEMRPLNLVTLFIGCRKLPKLDYASMSDPKVTCYIKEQKEPNWS
jgi:hypothetical protein